MIHDIEIAAICAELGLAPPRVVAYANCTAIIIRNGDDKKVLVVIDDDMSINFLKFKIASAFKIKAENLPSDAKLAAVLAPDKKDPEPAELVQPKLDPVTPAKKIRAYQEAKKRELPGQE